MPDTNSIPLPSPLLDSQDFQALSPQQQQSLGARLRHCLELAQSGLISKGTDLLDVLDELELDALAIMGSYSDPMRSVTLYTVHSSWTFECDREEMATHISPKTFEFLRRSLSPNAPEAEVRIWVREWAESLRAALTRFSAASSFPEAVAQLIAIDGMLASLLLCAATSRFNANIKSSLK